MQYQSCSEYLGEKEREIDQIEGNEAMCGTSNPPAYSECYHLTVSLSSKIAPVKVRNKQDMILGVLSLGQASFATVIGLFLGNLQNLIFI